jgi:AhpD family alkylhydroperoxidase
MGDSAADLEAFRTELESFAGDAPAVGEFLSFVESAERTETLDHKTAELLSLAIGVVLRCEPCILWHTNAALDAGATADEIDDVLQVAVAMGGGPAMAYATKARRVCRELSE